MATISLIRCLIWFGIFGGLVFYLTYISRSYFDREIVSLAGFDLTNKLPSVSICLTKKTNSYNNKIRRDQIIENPYLDKFLVDSKLYVKSNGDQLVSLSLVECQNMTLISFWKDDKYCTMVTVALIESETAAILQFQDYISKRIERWCSIYKKSTWIITRVLNSTKSNAILYG